MPDQPDNTAPPQDQGGMMAAPGDQDAFDEETSPEAKAHMIAAFKHLAGLGPHPGKKDHKIVTHREHRAPDDVTDIDRQRYESEGVGEASAAKMKAARSGGAGLGPPRFDIEAAQQQGALQQQAATAGDETAAQAQGAQAGASGPPTAPPPPAPAAAKAPPVAAAQLPVQPPAAPGPPEQAPEEQGPEQA
jgi:hypothetical protein